MTKKDIAKTSEFKPIALTRPRQYKANCSLGQFIRKDEPLGNVLKLRVITYKLEFFPERFKLYKDTEWLDIGFLDEQGVLSTLCLKGESLNNFLDTLEEAIRVEEKEIQNIVLEASFEKRSSDFGTYYVLKFKLEEADPESAEKMALFMSDLGDKYFENKLKELKSSNETEEEIF